MKEVILQAALSVTLGVLLGRIAYQSFLDLVDYRHRKWMSEKGLDILWQRESK